MKKISLAKKQGLTILETLVAIGILSIIVGAVIVLMVRISNYSTSAETRGLAIQYAQEAVDIVKNVRDNNYCVFFVSISYSVDRYYSISPSVPTHGSIFNISLMPSSSSGWVSRYTSGTREQLSTDMRRRVRIERVPGYLSSEAKRIIVEVDWITKGQTNRDTYKVISDVYKWK